jgi:hypothetical protein
MSKYGSVATMVVAAALSSGCNNGACTQEVMFEVVNRDIYADGRIPDEYMNSSIRKQGNAVYIGMALKVSPLYHRHYLIDPTTCSILDVKIDQ